MSKKLKIKEILNSVIVKDSELILKNLKIVKLRLENQLKEVEYLIKLQEEIVENG